MFFRKVCMKGYRLLCRLACRRSTRLNVDWKPLRDMSLDEVYSFFDENSADVIARHARRTPCPPSRSNESMSYSATRAGDGFHFTGNGVPQSWIYLSSKSTFPEVYAMEFQYIPGSTFREFLQLTFAGADLDNRHRFVIRDNEWLEYEMFWRGLFAKPVGRVPLSLPLHRASTIRLEVVRNRFSLLVNGREVMTVCDRLWRPRPTVGKLIFWNHTDPVVMDFSIGGFRYGDVLEVGE